MFGWKVGKEPNGMIRSKATKISIGDFVQLVGASTDRPVIDKTGLTGDFDYEIVFAQEDARTMRIWRWRRWIAWKNLRRIKGAGMSPGAAATSARATTQ